MSTKLRSLVTGLGIVSPVGIGVAAAWDSILHARSGIARVTRFDPTPFPARIAGEVKRIPVELADAREKLWTPEKEKPETGTKLWTPGSKEPA